MHNNGLCYVTNIKSEVSFERFSRQVLQASDQFTSCKRAPLTRSFEEERRAMQMALTWVEKRLATENSVAVFTDS